MGNQIFEDVVLTLTGDNSFSVNKIPTLKSNLIKNSRYLKSKVVKIKLKEAINSIEKLCQSNKSNVSDKSVIALMRYYQLLKELKK